MSQQIAWQASLVLMMLVALGFAFVALNSGAREEDYALLTKRAYGLRTKLFWVLVLTLGPVMIYTLLELPVRRQSRQKQQPGRGAGRRSNRAINGAGN